MAQFLQGAKFNLADALASDVQADAHFFQRSGVAVVKAEAHTENFFLAAREFVQNFFNLFAPNQIQGGLRRRNGGMRLNKVG